MRKLFLLCFIFAASAIYGQKNGTIVSVEYKGTITRDELTDSLKVKMKEKLGTTTGALFYYWATSFYIQPQYDIDLYKILYNTTNESDKPVVASGLIVLPKSNAKFPITAYCHGTVFKKESVPSNLCGAGECFEIFIPFLMASEGHIIAAPDYVGMGQSNQFHPYVESKSESAATLDLMRASKELLDSIKTVKHDGTCYLTGYSQGGHAAVSTLKAVNEQNLKNEFNIKFVGAGGSPIDLSNTQYNFIINNPLYPTREYILYCIATAKLIDPTTYNTPSDILKKPYDSLYSVDILGQTGKLDWIPQSWPDMFYPAAIDEMKIPGNKLEKALAKSNVYDFYNETPLRLYATSEDQQVTNKNSTLCEYVMRSKLPWWKRHLIRADIFSTIAGNTHETGGMFSFLYWTERIRNYKNGIGTNWRSSRYENATGTLQDDTDLLITPLSEMFLQIKTNNEIIENVTIINAENGIVKSEKAQKINEIYYVYTGNLPHAGFYKLRVKTSDGVLTEVPFMNSQSTLIEAEDLNETTDYIEFPAYYMVERGTFDYVVTDEEGTVCLTGFNNDGTKTLLLPKKNLKLNKVYYIELDNYMDKITYSFKRNISMGINDIQRTPLSIFVDNNNNLIRVNYSVSDLKSVELMSIEGKTISHTQSNIISTNGLSRGMYLVKAILTDGTEQTAKLIVP